MIAPTPLHCYSVEVFRKRHHGRPDREMIEWIGHGQDPQKMGKNVDIGIRLSCRALAPEESNQAMISDPESVPRINLPMFAYILTVPISFPNEHVQGLVIRSPSGTKGLPFWAPFGSHVERKRKE